MRTDEECVEKAFWHCTVGRRAVCGTDGAGKVFNAGTAGYGSSGTYDCGSLRFPAGRITLEDGTEPGEILQAGHNQALVFYIVADRGYKVKSILWDGEDATSWYRNGKLTIPALLRDGILQVIYEKENDVPATGDTFRSLTVWMLPITALMTIWLCRQKKRSRCV